MKGPVRIWLRLFGTASVIVGPIFGLLAIGFAIYTSNFIRHASHADGIITGLRARTEDDKSVDYVPTFTFQTPTGQTVTKESDTGSNPPAFSIAQHVPVLFIANDAENAKIATTAQLWLFPIVFGIISILFTPVGAYLLKRPQIANAPLPFLTKLRNV